MQEPSKLNHVPTKPDAQDAAKKPDQPPTTATHPTESAKLALAPKPAETAKPADTPKPSEATKAAEPAKQPEKLSEKPAEAPKPAAAEKPAEPSVSRFGGPVKPAQHGSVPSASSSSTSPPAQSTQQSSNWMPLLAACVGAAVIAAAWMMSEPTGDQAVLERRVQETTARLTSASDELKTMREAKEAVERTLAETRTRLAAEQEKTAQAEKMVADIKAALSSILDRVSAASGAATPTAPTSAPAQK